MFDPRPIGHPVAPLVLAAGLNSVGPDAVAPRPGQHANDGLK